MTDKERLEEMERALIAMSKEFRNQVEVTIPQAIKELTDTVVELGRETEASMSAICQILIQKGLATSEGIDRLTIRCQAELDRKDVRQPAGD